MDLYGVMILGDSWFTVKLFFEIVIIFYTSGTWGGVHIMIVLIATLAIKIIAKVKFRMSICIISNCLPPRQPRTILFQPDNPCPTINLKQSSIFSRDPSPLKKHHLTSITKVLQFLLRINTSVTSSYSQTWNC